MCRYFLVEICFHYTKARVDALSKNGQQLSVLRTCFRQAVTRWEQQTREEYEFRMRPKGLDKFVPTERLMTLFPSDSGRVREGVPCVHCQVDRRREGQDFRCVFCGKRLLPMCICHPTGAAIISCGCKLDRAAREGGKTMIGQEDDPKPLRNGGYTFKGKMIPTMAERRARQPEGAK
jgi:hypothetical protein